MIQKEHLRIGNLVKYGTAIYIVDELRDNNITLCDSEFIPDTYYGTYAEIEPIPLTEDLLVRLGFVQKESVYTLRLASFELVFYKYSNSLEFYLESVGVDIMYAHQLQNLIFALSGTNLKLNP